MGELLHSNAKTTIRVQKEIQESKESLAKLAKKSNFLKKLNSKFFRNLRTKLIVGVVIIFLHNIKRN